MRLSIEEIQKIIERKRKGYLPQIIGDLPTEGKFFYQVFFILDKRLQKKGLNVGHDRQEVNLLRTNKIMIPTNDRGKAAGTNYLGFHNQTSGSDRYIVTYNWPAVVNNQTAKEMREQGIILEYSRLKDYDIDMVFNRTIARKIENELSKILKEPVPNEFYANNWDKYLNNLE